MPEAISPSCVDDEVISLPVSISQISNADLDLRPDLVTSKAYFKTRRM